VPELITPEIRSWIGRSAPPQRIEITRRDIVKYAAATEQRLDKYRRGDEAPPMFLFGAAAPICALDELGPDGLRRDVLLPDLPLKRVMAGGTRQRYHRAIKPGDVVVIERQITDIYEKQGSSGPLIFIVYEVTIKTEDGELVLDETLSRINR
jgi:3-methylfumaryl-CoA hydratase